MEQNRMSVFDMITDQQKGKENTAVWMVGEQLKDICRQDRRCAEIVAQDLTKEAMSIDKAEKQIKAWADKQKRTGNCVCVPPNKAEEIIRNFYGLPMAAKKDTAPRKSGNILDLGAFL